MSEAGTLPFPGSTGVASTAPQGQKTESIDPAKILDQLKFITPEVIEKQINFCLNNIKTIRDKAKKELSAEKLEIQKLKRLARLVGAGVEVTEDGKANVGPIKPHNPRPDGETGGRLSDRIEQYVKRYKKADMKTLAHALQEPIQAVRMAVHRSGSRFEVDGQEVTIGKVAQD